MAGADHGEIAQQVRAFGANLRRARKLAGYTQAELSAATETQVVPPIPIDRAAISRLECGERSPDMPTLLRVGAALRAGPTDLLRSVGVGDSPRDGPPRAKRTGHSAAAMFGANLKWARARAGISQERLALDAKVDRAAISVYENGRREPNLRTVIKLALKLGIRPAVLLSGIEWSSAANKQ